MQVIITGRHISRKLNIFYNFAFFRAAPDGLAPAAPAGEPNEDGIVGGPRTPQQIAAQKRLQQTQAQVDEVCFFFN